MKVSTVLAPSEDCQGGLCSWPLFLTADLFSSSMYVSLPRFPCHAYNLRLRHSLMTLFYRISVKSHIYKYGHTLRQWRIIFNMWSKRWEKWPWHHHWNHLSYYSSCMYVSMQDALPCPRPHGHTLVLLALWFPWYHFCPGLLQLSGPSFMFIFRLFFLILFPVKVF